LATSEDVSASILRSDRDVIFEIFFGAPRGESNPAPWRFRTLTTASRIFVSTHVPHNSFHLLGLARCVKNRSAAGTRFHRTIVSDHGMRTSSAYARCRPASVMGITPTIAVHPHSCEVQLRGSVARFNRAFLSARCGHPDPTT
jgi:hypothetical protein